MKSAVLLAAGALLASAVPLDKRALETTWVTDIVTVTVTVDPSASAAAAATPSAGGVFIQNVSEKPAAAPSPPPAAAPSPPPQPAAPAPKPVYAPPPPPPADPVVTPQSVPKPPPQQAPPSPPPVAPKPVIIQVPAKPSPSPSPKPTPEVVAAKPSPKPSPSPPPKPAAPAAPSGSDYKSLMVNEHNIHRANHSAPALEWDDTLAGYAQTIAQGCVFAHDMNQGGGGYGQNLASWGSSGDIDDKQIESGRRGVTNQWYNDEMEAWTYYGLDNPPSGSNLDAWGHFTQVVWKDSTKVGCFTAKCAAGTVLGLQSWYTVCNYSPPGNFGGKYAENVLKPLGQPTVTV